MSGLEKILEHIDTDATKTANELITDAKAEAERILNTAKEDAKRQEKAIDDQGNTAAQTAQKRIESAAEQKEKRMVLEAKQAEIDKVITAALDKVHGLGDKEYFETILKMVAKYAHSDKAGKILFSQKDLSRLPAGFDAEIKKAANGAALELSNEAANIDGGFVLSYGDIEENCSFEALIEASRENLQDKIGQILFD